MTRTGVVGAVALLLALGVPTAPLEGQARPQNRQELERQIQQRFQQRVLRELALTPDEGRALNGVVQEFQRQRRDLVTRELRLRQRLRSTGTLLSDDEARDVLREMADLQDEEARLLRAEQERLLEVLSAPQVVRFYTLRAELAERIRRLGGQPPGGGARPLSGPSQER